MNDRRAGLNNRLECVIKYTRGTGYPDTGNNLAPFAILLVYGEEI